MEITPSDDYLSVFVPPPPTPIVLTSFASISNPYKRS